MTNKFLVFFLFFVFTFSAHASKWYVTANGNDTYSGKSEKEAFKTLQKAADLAQPGDMVLIGSGVYTNNNIADNGAVLAITNSGLPDAWITFKSIDGQKPIITPQGWSGIQVSGSYIKLEGLTVLGNNDLITLADALADSKNKAPNPKYNSNGITIEGRRVKIKPHHIIITNCEIGKCPGGGIAALETDYVTIQDCKIYNNAWFMRYGGSGITTLNNWAFDDAPGYHIIIQRNMVWNNKTLVPWEAIGKLSDGNGILLDVTDAKRNGASNPNADALINKENKPVENQESEKEKKQERPEWKGRALIANNLCAYNGGSGIHTFRTKHVDIINNTTYWNGQIVGYQELFPNNCEDIVILNNIIVPRPDGKVTSDNRNTNIKWDYNLYPVEQNIFKGAHDIVANPNFLNIQESLFNADFRLKKGSFAIGSGTDEVPQSTDLLKNKRPIKKRDRGAFEQ
jgi:hypothetical protein